MKLKLKYSILSKIPFMEILAILEKENVNYTIISTKEDGRSLQFEDHVAVTEVILETADSENCRRFVEAIEEILRSRYDKEILVTMESI